MSIPILNNGEQSGPAKIDLRPELQFDNEPRKVETKSVTVCGELTAAGQPDGQAPRMLIESTVEELKKLDPSPLYKPEGE